MPCPRGTCRRDSVFRIHGGSSETVLGSGANALKRSSRRRSSWLLAGCLTVLFMGCSGRCSTSRISQDGETDGSPSSQAAASDNHTPSSEDTPKFELPIFAPDLPSFTEQRGDETHQRAARLAGAAMEYHIKLRLRLRNLVTKVSRSTQLQSLSRAEVVRRSIYWQNRDRLEKEIHPDIARIGVPLLKGAFECLDGELANTAVETARQLAGGSRSYAYENMIHLQQERMRSPVTPWGHDTISSSSSNTQHPYQILRSTLLRLEREGDATHALTQITVAHVNASRRWAEDKSGLEDNWRTHVATAELFAYMGSRDLALYFWWRALESHEQLLDRMAHSSNLYLTFDSSGHLQVLVIPIDLIEGQGRMQGDVVKISALPLDGSRVFAQFSSRDIELALGLQKSVFSPNGWGRQRNNSDAEIDLHRAEILVGLAEAFAAKHQTEVARRFAERALQLCERPNGGRIGQRLLDELEGKTSGLTYRGRHLIFGLPSDVFRTAGKALFVLGSVDLAAIRSRVGEKFPFAEDGGLAAEDKQLIGRIRLRFRDAYVLALLARDVDNAWRYALDLVRLDILELTSEGATKAKGLYGALLEELEAEVLQPDPRRFVGTLRDLTKKMGRQISTPTSLRTLEAAWVLATRLAIRSGDLDRVRHLSTIAAGFRNRLWSGVRGEAFRISLAELRGQSYLGLIGDLADAGLERESLEWSERSRNQGLSELLGSLRPFGSGVGSLKALRDALSEMPRLAQLVKMPLDDRLPASTLFRNDNRTVRVDADVLQSRIPDDTCFLVYFMLQDRGWVWLLSKDSLEMFALSSGELECRHLAQKWRDGLFSADNRGIGGVVVVQPHPLDAATDIAGRELYQQFVEPAVVAAAKYRHWCIVPWGSLRLVSFAAFSDGSDYLVERHSLSYADSATVWQQIRPRPKKLEKIACLANPDVGKPELALPFAEREGRAVAKLFPQRQLATGRKATFEQLKEWATDANVLHVACHSVPSDEQGNRALLLTSTADHSGHVTYRDLMLLKSDAFLACLSACSSGIGEQTAGDELLGLSRGLIAAGVPTIVLSLWDVSDESTSDLMVEFYRRLAERDPAVALQEAQQIVSRKYKKPGQWAAFVIYGDWQPPDPDSIRYELTMFVEPYGGNKRKLFTLSGKSPEEVIQKLLEKSLDRNRHWIYFEDHLVELHTRENGPISQDAEIAELLRTKLLEIIDPRRPRQGVITVKLPNKRPPPQSEKEEPATGATEDKTSGPETPKFAVPPRIPVIQTRDVVIYRKNEFGHWGRQLSMANVPGENVDRILQTYLHGRGEFRVDYHGHSVTFVKKNGRPVKQKLLDSITSQLLEEDSANSGREDSSGQEAHRP